jgi:tRNA(Ile)-lysidine synthase
MSEHGLLARVAATGLIEPGSPVVVMLSGGRDSVCLLDVAVELASHEHVRALHINYGLRGEESDADEEACARLCAELDVRLTTKAVQRPSGSGNMHAWARDARYAIGAELSQQSGGKLAAAHTVDDQLETVLYRLATSPGRRALLGMPERSGALIRPLLAAKVTRRETTAWCSDRGLSWRDDQSNEDHAYARTRVRESLLPAFLSVDERAAGALLQTTELLRAEADALDEMVGEVLGDSTDQIERDRLRSLPTAIGRLVLRRMAESATGRSCPRVASRLPDVLALSAGSLDLGDGARVTVQSRDIRMSRTPPLSSGGTSAAAASLPPG